LIEKSCFEVSDLLDEKSFIVKVTVATVQYRITFHRNLPAWQETILFKQKRSPPNGRLFSYNPYFVFVDETIFKYFLISMIFLTGLVLQIAKLLGK
jgi:hypothetical protein